MNGVDGKRFGPRKRKSNAMAAICALGVLVLLCVAGQAQEAAQSANSQKAKPPAGASGPGPGQPGFRGWRFWRGQIHGIESNPEYPVLPIGSPAPNFDLPGIDGKMHTLSEYAKAKILVIVFESNHCPVSIAYEDRIRQIYDDYKDKGVQLVAINPNNPAAVRLDELGYTDASDSMAEMKVRAKLRHFDWPYLYDGATQALSKKFGAVATPHIFIFDQNRKLRYEGRIDNSVQISKVTENDARNALNALLAGKPVPVTHTPVFGCSVKWLSKEAGVKEEMRQIEAEPVHLKMAGADEMKKLRVNKTGLTELVVFWSLHCKQCLEEFHRYETTYRMYRLRAFNMVTVSTDNPADQAKVLDYLKQQYASGENLQFDSADFNALEAAVGEKWNPDDPFVMVIGPDGKIAYQKEGMAHILVVRRHVLATIPNDGPWFGVQEYWQEVLEGKS